MHGNRCDNNIINYFPVIYRNIFFMENQILSGKGNIIVEYTGRIYINAKSIKNLQEIYNPSLDLMISCTSCAKQKYKAFKKVNNDKTR